MNLYIGHHPHALPSNFPLKIDLSQAVKEKLGDRKELTNALALQIFREIKVKSDVLSFFMKPSVFISQSVLLIAAGLALPEKTLIKTILLYFGSFMLGAAHGDYFLTKDLERLSQAYSNQSKQAGEIIQRIESSDQELTFILED